MALQLGRELLSNCDLAVPTPEWPEPSLYIVTPTYRRPEQLPELTRMAQTLMHVRNLVWLVIEDANTTSPLVTALLDKTGIKYHQLAGECRAACPGPGARKLTACSRSFSRDAGQVPQEEGETSRCGEQEPRPGVGARERLLGSPLLRGR